MSVLVVDASVVLKWFFPEEGTAEAARLLEGGYAMFAPDLLFAETANTVWKKTLRGEITPAMAPKLIDDIRQIAVESVPCRALAADAFSLARALRHSIYDCLYLALALRLEAEFITADRRLIATTRSQPQLARYLRLLA